VPACGGAELTELLRAVLREDGMAAISVPLFLECEDVLARRQVRRRCTLNAEEQEPLFDAFLACTELEVHALMAMTPSSRCSQRKRATGHS
jgi:hypothetical protein